jgi:tyrosyl-tRNA synthetase
LVADAPTTTVSRAEMAGGVDAAELLARCELAKSKGEARRFLEQGGIYVNNVRAEPGQTLDLSDALHDRYLVLRRGPRQMRLVVVA